MRVRVRAVLSGALVLGASVFLRACEAPTARKAVATVNVTPGMTTLRVTQTRQLTAATLDDGGAPLTGRTVTWNSTNTMVATVNGSGLVTAVGVGTATITATSEGIEGTSAITVTLVPVISVLVAPSTGDVTVGLTQQLTATPRDSINGALTGRVVTWESSDEARATVSGTGLVTAVGLGAVTITATSEGVEGEANLTIVAPPAPVDSVAVSPNAATRYPGQTVQLTAATFDSVGGVLTGRTVTWESSNDAIATVSVSGLVTAVAVGVATITATSETIEGTSTITVDAVPVDSVAVTPPAATLVPAQTVQLTAATLDSAGGALVGRVVTWESSDDAVATVDGAGLVTAVAIGAATITATSEGIEGTSAITVEAAPAPVDSVAVTPPAATRHPGQTVQLTATTYDSVGGTLVGRVVTWESSDDAVATVNSSGLVTAVAVGVATITATSETIEGTATITVEAVPVDSVAVTPPAATRLPGQTVQLTAATFDSAGGTLVGRVVTWESSDDAVATVNGSGLVTAVAVGNATITATSEGVDGTAAITVSAVPVASVEVTPDSAEIEEGETQQFAAVTKDSVGGTLVGRTVTWTSLDGGIAGVNASGLATGLAEGVARIVATSEGKADTALLSVTAVVPQGEEVVGPFDLLVTGGRDNGQGVATDGVNALFALQGGNVGGGGNNALSYTIVDSTGAVLVAPTRLDNLNGDPPAAAYGGGKYLFASWIPGGGVNQRTVAWLIEQDGSSYSAPYDLATGVTANAFCGVAYAAGSFGVTYLRATGVNANGDTLTRVYGRSITTAGVMSGEIEVSPSWANCGVINNRNVASDGAQFLATWVPVDSASNSDVGTVEVRTISTAGALGTVQTVRTSGALGRALSVAARSTGGWVIALGELVNDATADFDAYLQALAADGSVSGGVVTLDNTTVSVVPTVADWASGFALVYIERPATGADQVVRLRRYNSAMVAQGADLLIAGADGNAKIPYGLVAAGGTRFFIILEYFPVGPTLIDFDQDGADVRGVWVRP